MYYDFPTDFLSYPSSSEQSKDGIIIIRPTGDCIPIGTSDCLTSAACCGYPKVICVYVVVNSIRIDISKLLFPGRFYSFFVVVFVIRITAGNGVQTCCQPRFA